MKLHKVLKCFSPWNRWIIFSRLNIIKGFVSAFSYLTLHAVNLSLGKKTLPLTLFKIITVSRPSTMLKVFFMGRLGCPTKRGNSVEELLRTSQKGLNSPLLLDRHSTKKLSPFVPLKANNLEYLLDKFYQTFCLRRAFSVTQS